MMSGGGTGGHIFPAIAIADKLRELSPGVEIRFVGAKNRMEMERVPKAGYPIDGLWISGLQRKLTLRNLLFPFQVVSSLLKSGQLLRRFRPHVVVGTGGFASGPLLRMAGSRGIPTLIQEQNAYAGLTNKLLASRADRICVAYPGLEKYFPAEKLLETGNPVRERQLLAATDQAAARRHFGLAPDQPTILVTGGSLGARTLNQALLAAAEQLLGATGQVLWQCGKLYEQECLASTTAALPNVRARAFIDRMDLAYAAADVVICRAGALTIAELCLLGKAAILVPSPNVAEDHQTKNAQALAERHAAILITDAEAPTSLITEALKLLHQTDQRRTLGQNAKQMAHPGATEAIAREVLRLANQNPEKN